MTIAAFGKRLLEEVHEETLDEFLRDLRAQYQRNTGNEVHHAASLGVKELDELLDIFLGRERQAPSRRLPRSSPLPNLSDDSSEQQIGIKPGDCQDHGNDPRLSDSHGHAQDRTGRETRGWKLKQRLPVLEISSPSSGAGKSHLLYYIAAVAILPSTYQGIRLGGRSAAVVLLDTDGRFEASRLKDIAAAIVRQKMRQTQRIAERAQESDSSGFETLLYDALQHVHIFRPQSSSALLATLQHLDTYLLNITRHKSVARPLHAILLDSASAFFWQDRLRDEVARTEEIGHIPAEIERKRQLKQSFHLPDLYQQLVVELRRLQSCFDCAVIYTTWGLSRATLYPGRPPSFKPLLPSSWRHWPILRLIVQRDLVRLFRPETTILEAEKDAPIRQDVVRRGKFSAWVDVWNQEEWPPGIFAALDRSPGRGSFPFYVTRDGVFMGDIDQIN